MQLERRYITKLTAARHKAAEWLRRTKPLLIFTYLTRRRGALDSDFKINVYNGWHGLLPARDGVVFFDELVGMAPSCYLPASCSC
jgi:hypothetical protein